LKRFLDAGFKISFANRVAIPTFDKSLTKPSSLCLQRSQAKAVSGLSDSISESWEKLEMFLWGLVARYWRKTRIQDAVQVIGR
jgi:hypothetical protein